MTFLWWKIERLSACNPEKRFWKAFLLAARIELRGIYPFFSKTCSHWIDCMVCTMYMLAYGCFSTLGCSKPVVILGHPLWWSWHQSPRWHLCHSCFNPLLYLCHFNPWKKTHQHPAIPSPHMKTHQPNCHHLPPSNTSFIAAGEASPGHHICLEASSWRGRPQVKRLTPSTASGWKRTSNLGEIFNQKERWDVGQLWDMTQKSPPKSEEPYPQVLGFASKIQSLPAIIGYIIHKHGHFANLCKCWKSVWILCMAKKYSQYYLVNVGTKQEIPQYWRWCVYMWSLAPHGPRVSFAGGQWPSYSVIIWKDKLYNNTQIAVKCSGTNEKNV